MDKAARIASRVVVFGGAAFVTVAWFNGLSGPWHVAAATGSAIAAAIVTVLPAAFSGPATATLPQQAEALARAAGPAVVE